MESTGRFTAKLRKMAHYGHDICSNCGQTLPNKIPAYAGYRADGTEAYVGACCQSVITELASHIYWWWRSYQRPKSDTTLWRYMDFAKFVAMLKDNALWFARVDRLGDPFEGARGIRPKQDEWKKYCLEYFRNAILSIPGGPTEAILKNIDQEAERLYFETEQTLQEDVKRSFASCWHANEGESEGLWRLYCPPPVPGVAITTKFSKLDSTIDCTWEVRFGHVQYIDFSKGFAGTYDRLFWKRSSLSHEREVRGVIQDRSIPTDCEGLAIKFDLDCIDCVVLSPYAPIWFGDVVCETMGKFGLRVRVEPSELLTQPFF